MPNVKNPYVLRRQRAWGKVLTPRDHDLSEKQATELAKERSELVRHWGEHPWYFLSGHDPTTTTFEIDGKKLYYPKGRPLIFTTDERDDDAPVKPFPHERPHLKELCLLLLSPAPERRIVLVTKSRQMMATTVCCLTMMWYCRFRTGRRCLISKTKEEDSIEVARDKVRAPYYRLPEWLQQECLLPERPANILSFRKTRSYIRCVTQNVAEAEGRGGTISAMLVDEAARQYMFAKIMQGILPAAGRVWGITTPDVGTPGAEAFYAYWDEKLVRVEGAAAQ